MHGAPPFYNLCLLAAIALDVVAANSNNCFSSAKTLRDLGNAQS
jgi:hypothetical protein